MRTLQMSLRLQGHPRHLGIHVGGFVLTRDVITTLAPVEPGRMQDRAVLPFDKDDVETLGLFKMDVLGLGMLTCIRKAFDLVNPQRASSSSPPLALYSVPADDPDVYAAISRADTVGVFQIESRAQMQMLPRLKPTKFYDLVIQVAIVRPGPIQGGMVHPYLKRRSNHPDERGWQYPHPSFIPILERTMGVPLFQEQVMQLAIVGAGYTAGDADQLRRDMAAWKKTGKLDKHRDRLIAGFIAHGVSEEFAVRVFEQVKGFGEYGFPESHAASFAHLVYASSWLKFHHPAAFACALLNSLPMGFYAPAQIVKDAQQHGIVVHAVDVTQSDWDCTLDDGALRLGMRLVKGLREDVGHTIAGERRHGAFVDVADVVRRARLDKRARLALAKAGAFDVLAGHRRAAMWAAMDPRPPLFARLPDEQPSLFPPTKSEVLVLDYQTVGLSIDDHPMAHVRPGLQARLSRRERVAAGQRTQLLDSRDVKQTRQGQRVLIAGLVIGRQRPGTADGTCFVTLEDEYGHINVIVWGREYERWRGTIVTNQFLLVDASIEREGQVIHAIARGVAGVSGRALARVDDRGGVGRAQGELPFASRDFH
ncbi:MAG TPA: OB-fold nucleic acid binding domain-containing protein [Myxococcota bacterium]